MAIIKLTKEQSKALATNDTESVRICDDDDQVIAIIPPKVSVEELAELRRRLEEAQAHPETLSTGADIRNMFAYLEKCEESLGRRLTEDELGLHLNKWKQRRSA